MARNTRTRKFTEEQIREIKQSTKPQKWIAADYGMSQFLVSRIKNGKRTANA